MGIKMHLIKKTCLEKKRNLLRDGFYLLIFLLVAVLHYLSQRRNTVGGTSLTNIIREADLAETVPSGPNITFYYIPYDNETYAIMEKVLRSLSRLDETGPIPVTDEKQLENNIAECKHTCFGIIFQNASHDGTLQYKILTNNSTFRPYATYSRDVFNVYSKSQNEYIQSGLLALQNAIDSSFIKYLEEKVENRQPKRQIWEFSYGHIPLNDSRSIEDPSSAFFWFYGSFVSLCVYLLLLQLVEERANSMKAYLTMVCSASYWTDIILFGINLLYFFIIILIFICVYAIWQTSYVLYYVYLLATLFTVHELAFTFFLSTTLESLNVATAVAHVCWLFPVLVSYIFKPLSLPLCVFPLNSLINGGSILISYQASGHLFQLQDMFNNEYPSIDELSLGSVHLMQLLGIILWLFMWFYVRNVYPGRYGIPKSKLFFVSKHFWRGVPASWSGLSPCICEEPDEIANQTIGNPANSLVRIKKLNKVYKGHSGRCKEVKDFSISIYKNNITVLLGNSGAGKTTVMNIISGMLPRTSGCIVVDEEHDYERYREQIGFCPQHNLFYSLLNCREHLELFSRLRGSSSKEAREEANTILKKVNLIDQSEVLVHALSESMKRRLSLAIAIVGKPNLLILDEPTSGLDPKSRRDVWDLLHSLRSNHTILLTTNCMEEAEMLGDWIAIMDQMELVAFGTYDSVNQDSSLIERLKIQQQGLAIGTISLTNGSLEEVFLNASTSNQTVQDSVVQEGEDPVPITPSFTSSALRTTLNAVLAIWRKKMTNIIRNYKLCCAFLLLPVIVTILCCPFFKSKTIGINQNTAILRNPRGVIAINSFSEGNEDVQSLVSTLLSKNNATLYEIELLVKENTSLENLLHNEIEIDYTKYSDEVEVGIEFNVTDQGFVHTTILHNNNLVHSTAIGQRVATNMIMQYYLGYPEAKVQMEIVPFMNKLLFQSSLGTDIVSIAFILYIPIYLQLPLLEHQTRFRQLQNINRYVYWISTYMFDLLLHILVTMLVVVVAIIAEPREASTVYLHMFNVLLLYGMQALLVMYIISKCAEKTKTAITAMSYLMIISICGVILLQSGYDDVHENSFWINILRINPEFALMHSMRIIQAHSKLVPFDGKNLPLMEMYAVQLLVIPFLVVVLNEVMENIYLREQITKALHCLTKSGFRNSRTSSGKYLADTIKKIGAVKRGECFGLFGMNGAGKSTLLQMLSRNVPISDGEMFLLNCEEQNSNALEYRDQYGYCPQVDSLLDFLTVYQTIDYFASIKNMNEREKHIIYWLKELDILAYKDHTVGECSASTKRKLHMILALLGDPPVVLLDEPTTGVDPNTRRCIWKCIKSIQRKGQTILLASHKINECEELCNRLSYINNGALEFIGSMLELKNKYGESFNERFQPDNNLAIDRVASFTDH